MKSDKQNTVRVSRRIQTSLLNTAEKHLLVWLAERMPRWVSSDFLSAIGFIGSLMIAAGYILSNQHIGWLWFCSIGYIVNWFGDSLDGTLARVRKTQRPIYGYYLDHTLDAINEVIVFTGAGLSALLHNFPLALLALVLYLMLTLNVSMNAHLKSEFKLTYAKLGPTEFRILMILVNIAFIFIRPLREFTEEWTLFGKSFSMGALDIVALVIIAMLTLVYAVTVLKDLKEYGERDPLPRPQNEK